jgi:DNA-binding transcriptional regulator YhcF (GntR family)
MRSTQMGSKKSEATRAKLSSSQPNSLQIEVTDLELNTKTTYPSIREAARALNINPGVIAKYFGRNQIKPVLRIKKRYAFAHLKK